MKQFIEKRYSAPGVGLALLGIVLSFIIKPLFEGFFKPMGNDLYNTSKQIILNSTADTLQIIAIIIAIAGFSLLGYGYWKTHRNGKKHELQEFDDASEMQDPKRQRENEGRFTLSNIK